MRSHEAWADTVDLWDSMTWYQRAAVRCLESTTTLCREDVIAQCSWEVLGVIILQEHEANA